MYHILDVHCNRTASNCQPDQSTSSRPAGGLPAIPTAPADVHRNIAASRCQTFALNQENFIANSRCHTQVDWSDAGGSFPGSCDQDAEFLVGGEQPAGADSQQPEINFEATNFSSMTPIWYVKSWPEILWRSSLVLPIVLLGVLGNLTIIYSMYKFKSFRSKPTHIFILNMALADLLTTIICPNAALLMQIYQFYILGAFMCRFEGFIKVTCLLVSAYSLIVLSFDWLLSVVWPCRQRLSIRQSWLTLALIWIISLSMSVPVAIFRQLRRRKWKDVTETWCCEKIDSTKFYWVGLTFFLIYLPTFIMTIVFVLILAKMNKFDTKLKRSNCAAASQQPQLQLATISPATSSSNLTLTPAPNPTPTSAINMRYRRYIIKILFAYLLTSIVCWTPLQATIIYRHFRSSPMPAPWFSELAFIAQLCASISSASNPIIFGFLSQPFRRVVTKSYLFKLFDRNWWRRILAAGSQTKRSNCNNNSNQHNNHNQDRNNTHNLRTTRPHDSSPRRPASHSKSHLGRTTSHTIKQQPADGHNNNNNIKQQPQKLQLLGVPSPAGTSNEPHRNHRYPNHSHRHQIATTRLGGPNSSHSLDSTHKQPNESRPQQYVITLDSMEQTIK